MLSGIARGLSGQIPDSRKPLKIVDIRMPLIQASLKTSAILGYNFTQVLKTVFVAKLAPS